jgi:hypothetical protein
MTDNTNDLFVWLEHNPNGVPLNEKVGTDDSTLLERALLLRTMLRKDSIAQAVRLDIAQIVAIWRRGHSLPRAEAPALMELLGHLGPPAPRKNSGSTALLSGAVTLLRANGYRVKKPRRSSRVKRRVGPTFVATFGDGEVTRMTTFTSLTDLDVERGMRLSEAAYCSRKRTEIVPPITKAHFEQDGKTLAYYSTFPPEGWQPANIIRAQTPPSDRATFDGKNALDSAIENALDAPAKGGLRWKDRGENHCSARTSRVVGGTYIIAWEDTHCSGKRCSEKTVGNYSVFYQPTKHHEPSDVSWLLLRSLEDAKALAQLDHDKRRALISRYGDKRSIPAEAWKQFRGELEDWQLKNNRERIAAEIAARKKST